MRRDTAASGLLGLVCLVGCGSHGAESTTASASSASAIAANTSSASPPAGASSAPSASTGVPDGTATASAAASASSAPATCPPASSPDRVVAFDWEKELGVEPPLLARLRGVTGGAVEMQLLAAQVDGELRPACAAIAGELGSKSVYASAPVACQAAVDAIKAARAKLGAPAKIAVNVHTALCPEPLAAAKDCAKRCNGDEATPEATCAGTTVGKCAGTCDGACELRAPAQCDGVCVGRCEGTFNGACAGICKGTCNGAQMGKPGECRGTCEGSCDAVVKGPCKGPCAGGCVLKGAACAGVCAGKCSVPVDEPRCMGIAKTAGTGAECAAYCELAAVHRAVCGAAQVDVHVEGAKDAKAKAAYESAIERHLPAILKVEAELKDHVVSVTKAKATIADGLRAITDGQSAALPRLSPCLFGYNQAAVQGTDGVLASYRAAVEAIAAAKTK